MVDGHNAGLETGAQKVSDQRHQRLKTSEPQPDYQYIF